MYTTDPSFHAYSDLNRMVISGESVKVFAAPTYSARGRTTDPSNGTCAVTGTSGERVNVELRDGFISRVLA